MGVEVPNTSITAPQPPTPVELVLRFYGKRVHASLPAPYSKLYKLIAKIMSLIKILNRATEGSEYYATIRCILANCVVPSKPDCCSLAT
jgi:hypothetical protein